MPFRFTSSTGGSLVRILTRPPRLFPQVNPAFDRPNANAPGRSKIRRARARVATQTLAAPDRINTCATERAVAPVVKMSSIEQDVFHRHGLRIGDHKRPAQVDPPLTRRETCLALCGTNPHHRI